VLGLVSGKFKKEADNKKNQKGGDVIGEKEKARKVFSFDDKEGHPKDGRAPRPK